VAGSLADRRPDIAYQCNRQRHDADEDDRRRPATRQQERPLPAEAFVHFFVAALFLLRLGRRR